jgi:hypothetical protein
VSLTCRRRPRIFLRTSATAVHLKRRLSGTRSRDRRRKGGACHPRRRIYFGIWRASLTDTCVNPKRPASNRGSRRFATTCAQEECRHSLPGTISRCGVGEEVSLGRRRSPEPPSHSRSASEMSEPTRPTGQLCINQQLVYPPQHSLGDLVGVLQ